MVKVVGGGGRMRRVAAGASMMLALGWAGGALAHHYDIVAVDHAFLAAADRTTAVRKGEMAYAWFSFYSGRPEPGAEDLIVKQLTEFDCAGKRMRAISQAFYDPGGRPMDTIDFTGEWVGARPGDRVAAMTTYACQGGKTGKTISLDDRELLRFYRSEVAKGFRVFTLEGAGPD